MNRRKDIKEKIHRQFAMTEKETEKEGYDFLQGAIQGILLKNLPR